MRTQPLDLLIQTTPTTDTGLLASIASGQSPSGALPTAQPVTTPALVSLDQFHPSPLSSTQTNGFFQGVQTDLTRLFAATNTTTTLVTALERLGLDDLSKIASSLDRLESQIQAIKDLQIGYRAGYTVSQRIDFIDNSSIEFDPQVTAGVTLATYDPQLQAISLPLSKDHDTLHTSSGLINVDVSLGVQVGYPVTAYSNFRTPDHAVDTSDQTYWAEVVVADEALAIPWPPPNSPFAAAPITPITQGAVCEYVLTYRQPADFTQLVIKPFCDLPINLAAIFVSKKLTTIPQAGETLVETLDQGYGLYLITEYNTVQVQGNRFLNQTNRLDFPFQADVRSVTLILHQPHATRHVFSVPQALNNQNALWQQMLGTTPLLGLPQHVLSTATVPELDLTFTDTTSLIAQLGSAIGTTDAVPASNEQSYTKYQYVYGAYDIAITDRQYGPIGQYVSTRIQSPLNLVQGTILADYDLPFLPTTAVAASAFITDGTPQPTSFAVPAATISFDLGIESSSEAWYPLASLTDTLVHEPFILSLPSTTTTLRLQAQPATTVYLSSFDGQGRVYLLGAVAAPALSGSTPTTITWPNAVLSAPGNYIVSYTPQATSQVVNFGLIAEGALSTLQKTVSFTGNPISQLRGVTLPAVPFIDTNRIAVGYDPNGDPLTEYVPLQVSLSTMPILFPGTVTKTGYPTTLASFTQDSMHGGDLYQASQVALEVLYSTDSNPNAAQNFQAVHVNWDIRPIHAPQLFAIAPNSAPIEIPAIDPTGAAVWIYDHAAGTIRFENGNAAVSGQIALTYWYYTALFSTPQIVNRTDYSGRGDVVLTPFDPTLYPVIEYVQVNEKLYFNLPLPATALITVTYNRLFDAVRVRATLTHVDPSTTAGTPHLYGYTFLARDANGTSLPLNTHPEVVWGDLEVYSLGTTTQPNPGIGIIAGNSTSAAGLPAQTTFNWYRIVNAGSVVDQLHTSYDGSNGTTVFWDFTNKRQIAPDGGVSNGLTYQLMNVDGSNTIPIAPGASVMIGIGNFLIAPGTPGAIHPATIYSGQTADYLHTGDWLTTAITATKETSIASVVIS